MNKYYTIEATIEGQTETLFGSYSKADCIDELQAERDNWRYDGYRVINVKTEWVEEAPDMTIYNSNEV